MMHIDFVGIKIGDLSNDASTLLNQKTRTRDATDIELSVEDAEIRSGQPGQINFTIDRDIEMEGFQWSISIDQRHLQFLGVESELISLSDENYYFDEEFDILRISWSSNNPVVLKEGDELFRIQYVSLKNGLLSQNISAVDSDIAAEMYAPGIGDARPVLEWRNILESNQAFVVQAKPNPFDNYTVIRSFATQNSPVRMELYNAAGQRIMLRHWKADKGWNEWIINGKDLPAEGIYYYKLLRSGELATGTLVHMKD